MQRWLNWVIAIILVSLLLIAIPLSYSGDGRQEKLIMFNEYVEKFNKSYKNSPAEYDFRFQHFLTSVAEIERLNAESHGPEEHKARYGLTKLSDLSPLEYKEVHLSDERVKKPPHEYGRSWRHGHDGHDHRQSSEAYEHVHIVSRMRRAALPMQVDWRTKGVIGSVKNQGLCGACWAFSTIGTAEAMNAIKTGTLTPLSVQEVVDCAALGNSGCQGGDICLLLDWLSLTNTPLQTEKEYPLRLADGACRLKKNVTGVTVTSFTCDSFVGSEHNILQAVASRGPVAVAVNALTWQNYLGGVIQFHCSGTPADLNHAVEIVGYDLTASVPYYIAKNSWGSEFGNGGYIHLAVGGNMCGLANEVATVDV